MSSSCLVCGRANVGESALLCAHCGAPMPDSSGAALSPPPLAGPRRRCPYLKVAALGVVVLAAIVGLTLWLRGPSVSGLEAGRSMPAGMTSVFGVDFHRILRHDWVEKLLDDPNVAQGVRLLRDSSGIDVMALESVGGGTQLIGDRLHLLMVVHGKFQADQLEPMLGTMAPRTVELDGGITLHQIPLPKLPLGLLSGGAAADEPKPESEEEPLPEDVPAGEASIVKPDPPLALLPNYADLLIGVLDDETFVLGSRELIERYLAGGDTVEDDETIGPLLEAIDGRAMVWGVGVVDASGLGPLTSVLDMPDIAPKIDGATYSATMRLTDGFEMELTTTLPSAQVAQQLKSVLDAASLRAAPFESAFALMGVEIKPPKITVTGASVSVSTRLPLPDLPGLL